MDLKLIGSKIQQSRKDAGLSQDELAAKAGVARGAIQQIEKGIGNPTVGTIQSLADAIGVSYLEFLAAKPGRAPVDYRDAAELLAKFSGLPKPYQQVVLALIHKDPALVRGLSDKTSKLAQALISAL